VKRLSQTSLFRLTSRAELLADRALVRGAMVACSIGILSAAVSTWGSARIGSGLLVVTLTVMAFMFCAVAAAFLIGGYARFRARAARGGTAVAGVGLAIALAGASFFAYVGISGLVAFFLSGGRGRS